MEIIWFIFRYKIVFPLNVKSYMTVYFRKFKFVYMIHEPSRWVFYNLDTYVLLEIVKYWHLRIILLNEQYQFASNRYIQIGFIIILCDNNL